MASQQPLPLVLTSHASPSPLSVNEFPATPDNGRKGLLHGETVPKDYGAQTLMASKYLFLGNLLDISPF